MPVPPQLITTSGQYTADYAYKAIALGNELSRIKWKHPWEIQMIQNDIFVQDLLLASHCCEDVLSR